jgi:hypothetical protein
MSLKKIVYAIWVFGAVSFVSLAVLTIYFGSHMPKAPNPQFGRTYPLSDHGLVVYLTHRENLCASVLECTSVGAGILFIAVGFFGVATGKIKIPGSKDVEGKESS